MGMSCDVLRPPLLGRVSGQDRHHCLNAIIISIITCRTSLDVQLMSENGWERCPSWAVALLYTRSYVTGSLCIIYLFCNHAMTPKPHWNGKSMPFLHATGCQHCSGWDGQLAKCEMCTDFGSRGDRHLVQIFPAVRWLYYSSWCGGRSPKWRNFAMTADSLLPYAWAPPIATLPGWFVLFVEMMHQIIKMLCKWMETTYHFGRGMMGNPMMSNPMMGAMGSPMMAGMMGDMDPAAKRARMLLGWQ